MSMKIGRFMHYRTLLGDFRRKPANGPLVIPTENVEVLYGIHINVSNPPPGPSTVHGGKNKRARLAPVRFKPANGPLVIQTQEDTHAHALYTKFQSRKERVGTNS